MEINFEIINEHLPRREREKAKHRQVILNAALKTFAQKGFHAATLDDIADAAEFSKGAIYNYFSNKENLLFEIMKQSLEYIRLFLLETLSGQQSFHDELIDLLKNTALFTSNHAELCDLFVSQHAQRFKTLSDENRQILKKVHDEIHIFIENRIQDAIYKGELDKIPPQIVSDIITGTLNSIVTFYCHYGTIDKINNSIELFVTLLYNGIASRGPSTI